MDDGSARTEGVSAGSVASPKRPDDGTSGPAARVGGDGDPTADEAAALERVRRVGWLLDDAIPVPGTDYRVGFDPVLGLLPVAGDLLAAVLSLYPVLEAHRLGVERRAIARMLAMVAVDVGIGSVPILGTVFDAVWKANEWNVRTLERHVEGD
jgi:hypothetical protein